MNAPVDLESSFWASAAALAFSAPDQSWRTYEAIKNLWQVSHPEANHLEYEAAMARIARLVRV